METVHQHDIIYMQRCIELARKGIRDTFTNPMVGCVIVHDNKVIGEGYHQQFGKHHAEINALLSIKDEDRPLLPHSTMYVSLEPCSHIGKTPACSHRIVNEGIKHVVIGCLDPNPIVAGRGLQYLRDHGVHVSTHLLNDECQALLKKFRCNLEGIPYIVLKWAQSADHYISKTNEQTWLSNEYTRILTHKWRSETESILVGKNTAMIDNPSLDTRYYDGPDPVRILMDSNLHAKSTLTLLSDGKPTIIINTLREEKQNNLAYLKVSDMYNTKEIVKKIFSLGISSVLVEGGAQLLKSFISDNCWHEARVIQTKVKLNSGIPAPIVEGRMTSFQNVGEDQICVISNLN